MTEKTKDPVGRGDVYDACEVLIASGKNITNENIRIGLGHRGSNTTINKYRNEWIAKYGAAYGIDSSRASKPIFRKSREGSDISHDPFSSLMQNLHTQVQTKLDEEKKRLQEQSRQAIQSSKDELETVFIEKRNLEKTLDQLNQSLRDLKYDNQTLTSNLSSEKQKSSGLKARAEAIEEKYEDTFKKMDERIEELKKQNQESQAFLKQQLKMTQEHYKKDVSDLKEAMENQRHKNIVEIDTLKSEKQKQEKVIHQLEMDHQKTSSKIQSLEKQSKQLKSVYDMLNKDFKEKTKELLNSEKERFSLNAKVRELENRATDEKQEKQQLQKVLLNAKEQIGSLLASLEEKKSYISKLEKEKTSKSRRK